MSVSVTKDVPIQAALGTTLTRVNPGDGVREIQLSTPSDVYVVYDDTLTDASAVPATARHKLPAGVWTLRVTGTRLLLAGVGAAITVTLLGGAAGTFGAGAPSASGGTSLGVVVGLQSNLQL
jgi:hypothetical protein